MNCFIAFLLFLFPLFGRAEDLRPELIKNSRQFLDEKITANDFLKLADDLKGQRAFSANEKIYLEDLTKKLPTDLKKNVCPTVTEGLCEDGPKGFAQADWPAVPDLPTGETGSQETRTHDSWFSRNSGWVAVTAAAIGVVVLGSIALRGKQIQFHSPR